MDNTKINTQKRPDTNMIYAYTLPGVEYLEGYIKIGQTTKTPEERIAEQTFTSGIKPKLEWQEYAVYKDGKGQFTDKQFHSWIVNKKGVKQYYDQGKPREIFELDPATSHDYLEQFANREIPINKDQSRYVLRKEQEEAVKVTRDWFESDAPRQEFLWNAKPRFGKTLTAFDLVQQMEFKKVLVVSNRPSISNSWADDFFKFLSWKKEYSFISDNDALKRSPAVLNRKTFLKSPDAPKKMIVFESLQGIKKSAYFGGGHDSLKWIADEEFDLLIVDESHEGVDTIKTERAFENIKRKHTLYLSGTPFKQLATDQFTEKQIFNWSYTDEQKAKKDWTDPGVNPYERLPRLCMFTYLMSEIIRDKAKKGIILEEGDDAVNYAFDLNEFFITDSNGKFVHEEDVKKFIRTLYTQEKYPFSTPELRKKLAHTMWYLNRVASAKALKELLENDEVFKDYKVIAAYGKEKDVNSPNMKAIERVRKDIAENDKTITLTVGQLTVGVTIPEWSAVMMLCNMDSHAAYMQAAFRAQNPYYELVDDELMMKETAYVFDFDPARTLGIVAKFASNLSSGKSTENVEDEDKIKELLNFLPVIGEDPQGKMVELKADDVLTLPRRINSREVVEHGFMYNLLFPNLGKIFSGPAEIRMIVEKLPMAEEEHREPDPETMEKITDIPVDSDGNVEIPEPVAIGQAQGLFGEKIYGIIQDTSKDAASILAKNTSGLPDALDEIGTRLKEQLMKEIIAPVSKMKDLKKGARQKIEKTVSDEINKKMGKIAGDYEQKRKIAEITYQKESEDATSDAEIQSAKAKLHATLKEAEEEVKQSINETVTDTIENKPASIIKEADTMKAQDEKRKVESEIRAHLRGFARTVPSFIMAYGDEDLRLSNFEKKVPADVFEKVTHISVDDFLSLRDGYKYPNSETGQIEIYPTHIFDEKLFDEAIQEFLRKKEELKNYFKDDQDEDIFTYIPFQKKNQVYTPRQVVRMMLDQLEKENPGCFDDQDKTFADLYMKSGLYIAEIVKRLFRSKVLKEKIKDPQERLRHIFEKQVFGLAPDEIIYKIATNYLLGFTEEADSFPHNFRMADAVSAAKKGTLGQVTDAEFKNRKK